jgi:hypothetical protein
MAVGDSNLFLSRDTRVYIEQNPTATNSFERQIWELPILNGYSFSQATNASQVTVNEMTDSTGRSRRGQRAFNDSLAAAEWSLSTYAKPTVVDSRQRAPEEALWAALLSESNLNPVPAGFVSAQSGLVASSTPSFSGTSVTLNFGTPSTGDTYFKVGDLITVSGVTASSNAPNGTFPVTAIAAGNVTYQVPVAPTGSLAGTIIVTSATVISTANQLDFLPTSSNKTSLGTFNLYFILGGRQWTTNYGGREHKYDSSDGTTIYRISGATVNEASLSFDIDGITTIAWSGMGNLISELASVDFLNGTSSGAGGAVVTASIPALTPATAAIAANGVLTLAGATTQVNVGDIIRISGALTPAAIPGYNTAGTNYYVTAIAGSSPSFTATLSLTPGGSAITATAGALGASATVVKVPASRVYTNGITNTDNMIRNRLTALSLTNNGVTASSPAAITGATATIAANASALGTSVVTLTYTSTTSPYFTVGQQVIVSGISSSVGSINGPQTVTGCTATTITFNTDLPTSTSFSGSGSIAYPKAYNITLTGGTVTISNNMTFLTPESLGIVNQPLNHVTGTRSVSGSFTCYLDEATDGSIDLYQDMLNATTTITNNHELNFYVGGKSTLALPVAPGLFIDLAQCHLEIPSMNIDDVIGMEVNFTALPTSLAGTDEISKIRYVGK